MGSTEITLPEDFAERLIQDGAVRRGLGQRGDWATYATLAVDTVSMSAAVLVSWEDLRSVVARFAAHAGDEAADRSAIEVTVSVGGESHTLVEVNDGGGTKRIEVRIMDLLPSDHAPSEN